MPGELVDDGGESDTPRHVLVLRLRGVPGKHEHVSGPSEPSEERPSLEVEDHADGDGPEPTATGAAGEPEVERRVGWAELLFDLVFVVAVTQTSSLIASDVSAIGLLRSLVVFVPVYWMWVGTAIQTNLNGAERPLQRIRLFAIALAAVFMAIALPDAYGAGALIFAFGYWLGRIILGLPVVASTHDLRTPYGVSIVLTGPLLVLGALIDGPARLAVWGFVAVADLATPWVFARVLRTVHYDAGHLVERYGLFVLIALGESMVAVVPTSHRELSWPVGAAVAAAVVVACGVWWLYFHYSNSTMRRSLETTTVQITVVRNVLSYGHLAFICSIVVLAVGIHHAIVEPTRVLGWPSAALLYGGAAAFCATFGFTRWVMWRWFTWRVVFALVLAALLPLAAHLPALAAITLLAVAMAGINAFEWYRHEIRHVRHGGITT